MKKRENESILIAVLNNAIRTNYINAKIDNIIDNCKCRLCVDTDVMVNHIISERRKLAQKEYKTKHDWVGKVIHWELCKGLKFDHTSKLYIHKPEWGCPRGVRVKMMDGGIVVSEFELKSRYYVHFRTNTLGKGMNPIILHPTMG